MPACGYGGASPSLAPHEAIWRLSVRSLRCGVLAGPDRTNELITEPRSHQRQRPRRSLIECMVNKASEPELAIAGYPPEKSIYLSVLGVMAASGARRPLGIWAADR